ncbi:MerR family DNA-binding transcriptional regulator [Paenibacillus dendritiformis]|uniref:MerR family DNA-binding transcriptional regulator n=1 Tax=Paenibacillus dendritiformis TaxID=130049 RepID=UPI0030B9018D
MLCCIAVITMFRIGEFSKLTQVSIRMLRYYDEVGLLKPARVDKLTGYRLFHRTNPGGAANYPVAGYGVQCG